VYSGAFTAVHLPALKSGLAWSTNLLASSGTITVESVARQAHPPVRR
jgi:hypothetical protein